MNILLINHYAGSPKLGMEYRPYYMAKEWVDVGHKVIIIGATNAHVRSIQPKVEKDCEEEDIDGITYLWIKTPPYRGNGFGRIRNMFSFVYKLDNKRRYIADKYCPDVVIASSTYPLDNYPASKIAKLSNAKFVYEVHDLWPLSPMELGGYSKWNPFIMIIQKAENFAYKYADYVISMLPRAQEHMFTHGLNLEKFKYVPNGIHLGDWQASNTPIPEEHQKTVLRLKRAGHFVVGYVGSHGPANALQNLIDSAALLQAQPAFFVLVGQGSDKEALQKTVLERGLTNLKFLPPVPKKSVPALLALMDLLYIGWKKIPLYRFGVSPNKLMDYMMAEKPVIHAIEAGNDLVAESGCGISIPPESPEAIAEAVMKLMAMAPSEREAMGFKGRQYVLDHHDYKILAQQFLSILVRKSVP